MITATGAQIITGILERRGVKTVYGIPGGMILPLYDELARSKIRHILVRQEQAGGFMAQGEARITGKAGVCLATSGPGAMNLLTAIADARSDSIPLVAITGQVNRSAIGTDAFQETDTFGLSMPICKHSVMVKSAEELLKVLPKAFEIAESGRPGPVLIDVPRDVQNEVCSFSDWPKMEECKPFPMPQNMNELAEQSAELFANSNKTVIFCGGGAVYSKGAPQLIEKLSKDFALPVCTSLMGLSVGNASNPLFCGMVGMHGSYTANRVMYESTLILAVGVRFDDRATGLVAKFCPNAKIIHIDIDAAEINKIYQSSVAIAADAADALKVLCSAFAGEKCKAAGENNRKYWPGAIEEFKKPMKGVYTSDPVHPNQFMPRIEELFVKANGGDLPYVATDVGQHQMFTAQCFPIKFPRQLLTSGSLGTMGFGLPAANGAAFTCPNKRVICFSGDGSIMMNVQELATLAELDLNVTVIVFDNQCLGMVRQQQEMLFNQNYSASIYDKNPDLVKIAQGFNIKSYDLTDFSQFDSIMTEALSGKGPRFVRIPVAQNFNVLPFVPGGKANIDAIGLAN